VKYVSNQLSIHKLPECLQLLLDSLDETPGHVTEHEANILNQIDCQFTNILLAGKKQCACQLTQRQSWPPRQREIARTFTYWKQKLTMSHKKYLIGFT
jgi:hypothetical protein